MAVGWGLRLEPIDGMPTYYKNRWTGNVYGVYGGRVVSLAQISREEKKLEKAELEEPVQLSAADVGEEEPVQLSAADVGEEEPVQIDKIRRIISGDPVCADDLIWAKTNGLLCVSSDKHNYAFSVNGNKYLVPTNQIIEFLNELKKENDLARIIK